MTHYGTKPSFLTDFCSPWNSKKQAEITFKAVWDTERIFSLILKFLILISTLIKRMTVYKVLVLRIESNSFLEPTAP